MTESRRLPEHPRWTRGQKLLAAGSAAGALVVVAILALSLQSVRSLEAQLVASEDASEQFIAVMREASRVELELVRAARPDAPRALERVALLDRHIDVLRAGAGQHDLDQARTERVATILAANDRLQALTAAGGDLDTTAELASTIENAAKTAADLAETARRTRLLEQVASANSIALATLLAIAVVIAIIAALLLSLRRRSIVTYAEAYDLAVARARQLEDSNQQLQEANATKQRFLSLVSHELRTPLTVIRGFAETLAGRSDDLPEDQHAELAGAIVRHALRQQRMVDDLLVLTRHADHAPETTPTATDLADLLARIVDALPVADTTVEVLPGPWCEVWTDPHHLEQVVENLLTNAGKYGGPHVELSWAPTATEVVLVVEDDGPGVPDEFLPALFTPFAQADDGDTRVSRGVGLGLSITRLLMDANGGHIRYRHRTGGGARFEVVLPRYRPEQLDRAAPGTVGLGAE